MARASPQKRPTASVVEGTVGGTGPVAHEAPTGFRHVYRAVLLAGIAALVIVWRTGSPPHYSPNLVAAPGTRELSPDDAAIQPEVEPEWVTERTCLVTGSNGMFGLTLVDELLADGWQVIATHRAGSDTEYLQRLRDAHPSLLRLVVADVTDVKSLLRAVPKNLPALFHVAARIDTAFAGNDGMYAANVLGTRHVVNVALHRGVRKLVHTSSIGVYFHKTFKPRPIQERLPRFASDSFMGYTNTKYLSELEVEAGIQRGLWAVILQPAAIIGKYDTSNWARLAYLLKDEALPGAGPAVISCAHGKNVARAHINALSMGKSGESYVLGGPHLSFSQMADRVREIGGFPRFGDRFFGPDKGFQMLEIPESLLQAVGLFVDAFSYATGFQYDMSPEIAHISSIDQSVDSTKARLALNYNDSTPADSSIKEMIDFLKANRLV